ncbi:hypothetical protein AWH48_16935 [Domibacillus aminovorans]|uniref:Uncharacterized protein n=1 Tax=Domibacillus aminovorans TaxID=29332 RepID=A0A177KZS3_9BACI|nr:hypothetical protein [Domibacillus aminovorans]OAH58682.1 hypothetical protein AWH48_16935 [Domibacillus aminovorans]
MKTTIDNEQEPILMTPDKNFLLKGMEPVHYLIERISDSNYVIHRQLENGEYLYYRKRSSELFDHNGKLFLSSIENAKTLEQAQELVLSYWQTIKSFH